METNRNNQSAFMPVHPGEVLKAELEERGLTQKAFAEKIGMRPSHLSELLNGKRPITIAVADKLQEALGIESQSWMNLQTQFTYDCKVSRTTPSEMPILEVSISDPSLLSEIKTAISLLRGVGKVAML